MALMVSALEASANAVNAVSIVLAARNNIHTWWVGIVGCGLFLALFFLNQLYADALLQVFFCSTSVRGWYLWAGQHKTPSLEVTRVEPSRLAEATVIGVVLAVCYGYLLRRFTDAYFPFLDSLVLVFSIVGQLLLMRRRYESWWIWVIVNVMSVALFASRGLWLTATLYLAFLANASVALFTWRRLIVER